MKKISFIVPCYKVERYLPRCLESVVNQTLDDIEIICINDGSPDNCINILHSYQEKYGDKIVIIDKKNEGVWRGRHDGVKIATGEYIGFVDSDDYVALDYAEKLYKAANEYKADISVCGFDRIDLETGKLYSREMCKGPDKNFDIRKNSEKILTLNGAPWNKIYKAHLLKEMEDLPHPPKILDDMMFLLLAYVHAKRVAFVPESLVFYMIRSDSIINTIKEEQIDSTYRAMIEVKDVYKRCNPKMIPLIDAMAFLHLGVSLMFRLSYDPNCDLSKAIHRNIKFMDKYFSGWRNCKYLTISYMRKNGFDNLKLWVVRWVYRVHLFRAFLAVYKFMINKLKIDIKW